MAGIYLIRIVSFRTANASNIYATATATPPTVTRITLTTNAANSISSSNGAVIVDSEVVAKMEEILEGGMEKSPHIRERHADSKVSLVKALRVSRRRRHSFSGKLPIVQASESWKKSAVKRRRLLAWKSGKIYAFRLKLECWHCIPSIRQL